MCAESPEKIPISSLEGVTKAVQDLEAQERLYSIALFDILGFSQYVETNGTETIMKVYTKLMELVHKMESTVEGNDFPAGCVAPVPISPDWKQNQLVAEANGFIRVCHFSDTFLIYVNYDMGKNSWWLRDFLYEPYPLILLEMGTQYATAFYEDHHIYISFLNICMEFFCEAIRAGIPLRGCISTGLATMNQKDSIYFGRPLVEAARGETAQNCIGVAYGKSFNNYHPVYNRYFIPYLGHFKGDESKTKYLSPLALDWPRYWRDSTSFRELSISDCIKKMNQDSQYSVYYENAIKFANFSRTHEDWPEQINRENLSDILTYYERVKAWYNDISR